MRSIAAPHDEPPSVNTGSECVHASLARYGSARGVQPALTRELVALHCRLMTHSAQVPPPAANVGVPQRSPPHDMTRAPPKFEWRCEACLRVSWRSHALHTDPLLPTSRHAHTQADAHTQAHTHARRRTRTHAGAHARTHAHGTSAIAQSVKRFAHTQRHEQCATRRTWQGNIRR